MIRNQVHPDLPCQFSKQTFRAIAADRDPKPFSHDNADATVTAVLRSAHQHVEQSGGNPTTMLLDVLDVAAGSKKQSPISSAL